MHNERLQELFFAELPRYRHLGKLGQGGMGTVYRVHDVELGEDVALKVLHRPFDDPGQGVERLKREIILNRRIKHPNVARLYEFGQAADFTYVTMELIEGRDLARVREEDGPLSPAATLHVLRQIALGAGAAHSQGIVHRDLTPRNVMVATDGGVALLDFGLARGSLSPAITGDHHVVGTPLYMSPEVIMGHEATSRSDVYAIGAVAFELLTGAPPFAGGTYHQVMLDHVLSPVPEMRLRSAPGVPASFCDVVLRCLQKTPAARFGDGGELDEALARVAVASCSFEAAPRESHASPGASVRTEPVLRPVELPVEPAARASVVLVVDDDEDALEAAVLCTRDAGYGTRSARDGEEALQALEQGGIDLVLMDVNMYGLDGFDTTRVIRSQPRYSSTPVILMSSAFSRSRLAFAVQSGATGLIPKPLVPEILGDRIRHALERG